MARVRLGAFILLALGCGVAHAQRPDPGHELELIESTERSEDPLGIDQATGQDLARAAAAIPKPRAVLPVAQRGAALSAIDGVREDAHELHVALDRGLANISVRMTFSSRAKYPAELAYRLPLPDEAVVTRVQLCRAKVCVDAPSAGASLEAVTISDERGRALSLRLAPVTSEGAQLLVSYVARAPLHGGVARLAVGARGYDPNLAPTELHVASSTLGELTPARTLDPWQPVDIRGVARKAVRASMEGRSYQAAPFAAAPARATHLFIDASPSMEGPARSRLPATLGALLAVLPEQTELSASAFAFESQSLGQFRAGDAPLVTLADAAMLELGAASKVTAIARAVRGKPRVIVLSDGLFDATPEQQQALNSLRARGVETWLVQLAEVPSPLAGAFSEVLDVSREAEATLHGVSPDALEDRLRAIAAASVAGVRAGEERVREVKARGTSALARWMRREDLQLARGNLAGAIEAPPYVSVPPAPPPADTGMPKESVLSMLRTQLIPQARACLRSDRKGRADYAVALTFHAVFAQREIYAPAITGSIPAPLRQCLVALLPKLRVPAFSGRIRVRYPIFTEREQEAPAIELEPELGQKLERAFAAERALP